MQPDDVISFWREAGPEKWFKKSDAFDEAIRERFGATWDEARTGRLDGWAGTAEGRLALILVLDQFPRNMFRESAKAFATDETALRQTYRAIGADEIEAMPPDLAVFALMPLMHSESIVDQDACVREMLVPRWEENFRFAVVHRDVIRRFGRFPHRNPVLGRATTPAERAFLDMGGFGG